MCPWQSPNLPGSQFSHERNEGGQTTGFLRFCPFLHMVRIEKDRILSVWDDWEGRGKNVDPRHLRLCTFKSESCVCTLSTSDLLLSQGHRHLLVAEPETWGHACLSFSPDSPRPINYRVQPVQPSYEPSACPLSTSSHCPSPAGVVPPHQHRSHHAQVCPPPASSCSRRGVLKLPV